MEYVILVLPTNLFSYRNGNLQNVRYWSDLNHNIFIERHTQTSQKINETEKIGKLRVHINRESSWSLIFNNYFKIS